MLNLQQAIEQYHSAVDEFSRGDPEPAKRIFSELSVEYVKWAELYKNEGAMNE